MGYPMTFGRWSNRNGLEPVDYGQPLPERWRASVNLGPADSPNSGTMLTQLDFERRMAPHWRERLVRYEAQLTNVFGDMRRLISDAQDENAVCKRLAERTGIDPEVVAVVLKEFLSF